MQTVANRRCVVSHFRSLITRPQGQCYIIINCLCSVNCVSPAAVVTSCWEDVKVTVVYSLCRNIAPLIIADALKSIGFNQLCAKLSELASE